MDFSAASRASEICSLHPIRDFGYSETGSGAVSNFKTALAIRKALSSMYFSDTFPSFTA
jgi:hypothetical protein